MISSLCSRCGTELPPGARACPACATLRYADELKRLSIEADAATRAGNIEAARDQWFQALELLPADSQQYSAVQQRIADLAKTAAPGSDGAPGGGKPWWRQGIAGIVTLLVLLAGKFKFLLLGLTKLSTFVSMFAFFGLYWSLYGWPLALGLVLSIYIHEMGHVYVLRKLGIAAGAPLFIPGFGAVVMLKHHVTDPVTDARIGLAGPVWGLGAALAALSVYGVTHAPIWFAIAEVTGFLNLFNLIPVWQLDGSRGFHALSRVERWVVVAACAGALALTGQKMVVLVGGVAVWRALQRETGPGHTQTLVTFVGLVLALSFLAQSIH